MPENKLKWQHDANSSSNILRWFTWSENVSNQPTDVNILIQRLKTLPSHNNSLIECRQI